MVEFVILGPHGSGKHRLAKALKCWRIFRCEEQFPQDSSGAYLSRTWIAPSKVGAHILFKHASGSIFKVYILLHCLKLRVGYVTVRGGEVIAVSPADLQVSRAAESWLSSEL